MIDGRRVLAIIPARGGSKRLPRKNVLPLNGKPLIAWTIEAALSSKFIDKVIVSTDDKEVSEIAETFGATVPFVRPSTLSSDTSTSVDVVKHALEFLYENSDIYDIVILLQPTSPLRTTKHINEAMQLFRNKKASGVISVCPSEHSPLWANVLNEDFDMSNFISNEFKNIRSQDLPTFYRLNGAIYISNTTTFKKESTFILSKNLFAYVMQPNESTDIDEKVDFYAAEYLMLNSDK